MHMKTLLLAANLITAACFVGAADQPPAAPAVTADAPLSFSGKVAETMNAASYTYVLVDTGTAKYWAAAPQFEVKLGDVVEIESGMPMPKYHSKSLNRDFEVVYFTGVVKVQGAAPKAAALPTELPKGHPPIGNAAAPPAVDLTGIKPAKGGKTVAVIVMDSKKLAGSTVTVRGKVVKYNAGIMGKNWLHIRDGSGSEGSNDLTLTTATAAKVGDTVLVKGKVTTDRDFGSGYKYSVMIEDAEVVVE
jgi:ribosomal protein S17